MGLLETNGLSLEILADLSYRSQLGKSLKNNLNSFEKESLLQDAFTATEWFDANELLGEVALDYRVKSEESIRSKYERYYPDRPVQKVFNDLLGFRALCTSYDDALHLESPHITVVDMSHGKAHDDGYRGVHLYYKIDNFHYPIELQFNTFLDRQLNDWLHDYVYKKNYPASVGSTLRILYEYGGLTELESFKEAMSNVLSDCER